MLYGPTLQGAECLRMIVTLPLNPAQTQLISGFVDTYLKLNAQDEQRFQQEISKMETAEQDKVMQIVTSWMEQGIEQGAHAVILRLINRKFGQITSDLTEKVQALSFSQTESLSESLLDFESLGELTEWLNQHSEA